MILDIQTSLNIVKAMMVIYLLWNGYLHSFNVDFNDDVHRFFFRIKNLILQLEFDIDLNLHLFNLIVMFTLYLLDQKYSFQAIFQLFLLQNRNMISGKFIPKTNFLLKLKFATYTNLNVLNSMLMFTFSTLDWK